MKFEQQITFFKPEEYDLTKLPEGLRDPTAQGFEQALVRQVKDDYLDSGLYATVSIINGNVVITKDTIATELAEMAETWSHELVYTEYEKAPNFSEKAVAYCLDALEKFHGMPEDTIANIAMEAAMLCRKGLDLTDTSQTYVLRPPFGKVDAMRLACILQTAVQVVAPRAVGLFGLTSEYEKALRLFLFLPNKPC
jgi:hypothetical protein